MTLAGTISISDAARCEWDALVIGAGPAGSVAARELARRGLSVLLVDKAAFPRGKVCGCCLNGAGLASLRAIGLGGLPARCGAVPLQCVQFAAAGRTASFRLPDGVAVSREEFDAALIGEAVAAGVAFLPSTFVKRTATGWVARSANDSADSRSESATLARVAVIASGLSSQFAPAESVSSPIGAGTLAPDGPREYATGTIFMALDRSGYVGLVRLPNDHLDIAAAFDPAFLRNAGSPGLAAESVLREAGFPLVPNLANLPWRGTPPLMHTPRERSGPGWFAVGDAAGYVAPITGEGMAWAIASAVAAAPLIARAARAPNWDASFEVEWEATYTRVIRRRQSVCRAAAWMLRSPTLTRLSLRACSLVPALANPILSRLNRPSPTPEPFA